jgi:hypothetical protein
MHIANLGEGILMEGAALESALVFSCSDSALFEMLRAVGEASSVTDRGVYDVLKSFSEITQLTVRKIKPISQFGEHPFANMIGCHHGIECMTRVKAVALDKIRSFIPKFLQEVGGRVQSKTRHAWS